MQRSTQPPSHSAFERAEYGRALVEPARNDRRRARDNHHRDKQPAPAQGQLPSPAEAASLGPEPLASRGLPMVRAACSRLRGVASHVI